MNSASSVLLTLLSLLWLTRAARGVCRLAGIAIAWNSPIVAGTAVAAVLESAALASTRTLPLPAAALLGLAAVNAVTDLQTGYMFDAVELWAAAIVAVCSLSRMVDAATGAAVAVAILSLPYLATRGRGFGFGDVKFGAVIGLALGARGAVVALFAAFIAGGTAAACLLACRRASRTSAIVFGPFLSFGAAWAVSVSALS
jgi:prepilin signal peptidase PulO-like enzyme (type II secretory pathway)